MSKEICGCGQCTEEYQHASDCAVHNEPAFPNGECDCRPTPNSPTKGEEEKYQRLFNYLNSGGFVALQSEMDDIIQIVKEDFMDTNKAI